MQAPAFPLSASTKVQPKPMNTMQSLKQGYAQLAAQTHHEESQLQIEESMLIAARANNQKLLQLRSKGAKFLASLAASLEKSGEMVNRVDDSSKCLESQTSEQQQDAQVLPHSDNSILFIAHSGDSKVESDLAVTQSLVKRLLENQTAALRESTMYSDIRRLSVPCRREKLQAIIRDLQVKMFRLESPDVPDEQILTDARLKLSESKEVEPELQCQLAAHDLLSGFPQLQSVSDGAQTCVELEKVLHDTVVILKQLPVSEGDDELRKDAEALVAGFESSLCSVHQLPTNQAEWVNAHAVAAQEEAEELESVQRLNINLSCTQQALQMLCLVGEDPIPVQGEDFSLLDPGAAAVVTDLRSVLLESDGLAEARRKATDVATEQQSIAKQLSPECRKLEDEVSDAQALALQMEAQTVRMRDARPSLMNELDDLKPLTVLFQDAGALPSTDKTDVPTVSSQADIFHRLVDDRQHAAHRQIVELDHQIATMQQKRQQTFSELEAHETQLKDAFEKHYSASEDADEQDMPDESFDELDMHASFRAPVCVKQVTTGSVNDSGNFSAPSTPTPLPTQSPKNPFRSDHSEELAEPMIVDEDVIGDSTMVD